MADEKVWQTEFTNKRTIPATVVEYGREMLIIPPGKKALLRAWDPYKTTYARFSEVIYGPGDKEVSVVINREWKPPADWADKFIVELVNNGPNVYEILRDSMFGDEPITLMRGIPKLIAVTEDSSLAKFSKVEWKTETIKELVGNFYATTQVLRRVEILRP
jgi:hypothetical protein